ncbi:maleylpyruvate isomerase family mycothiol-dependent enzyme [Spirillospora sp. CA-294931]|uniref:maleylpyruvate isomerase family mycothiol-dependent enzyme n=1 Tax=Spirillospora sp. CA-294931 TaxID=3240042 RepID=UPI003D8CB885
MEPAEMWRVIDTQRSELAELFEGLSDEQWACQSLCEEWSVREVGAHLSLGARTGLGRVLVEVVRARGNFDRMVADTAIREARRPRDEIVAELRTVVGSRHLAPGQKLGYAMMDVLVHGQDICVPLGLDRAMPLDAARYSAEQTWRMGFPFHARKRLAGYRLTATDVEWTAGEGAPIEGPIASLLLLLSGRDAGLDHLTGEGAARLAAH